MSQAMNWKDPEMQINLLKAILAANDNSCTSGSVGTKVAGILGCTAKAVSHQLVALRKDLDKIRQGDPSAPATPKKRKNNDDESDTTAKKAKTPKSKSKTRAKDEDNEAVSDV